MFDEGDLDAAVEAGLIDAGLAAKLKTFAAGRRAETSTAPRFDLVNLLYYMGALIVIGAMGLFATAAFEGLGGWGLFAIALVYAAGLLWLGDRLWRDERTRLPGGLLIAAAVSMTPLAIYGVQDALGLWAIDKPRAYRDFYPFINGSWIHMELGAILAAALALRKWPFPFIVSIIAVALWFLSMDLAEFALRKQGSDWSEGWEWRRNVSEAFGLVMIAAAWTLDVRWRSRGDFGFWLHLFGAIALWGAITAGGGGEFAAAGYCLFNLVFIGLALFLDRRIYAVLGVVGVAIYLGHLAADVFSDALSFTFALTALGLAIVFAGIGLERKRAAILNVFDKHLPAPVRALRPRRI